MQPTGGHGVLMVIRKLSIMLFVIALTGQLAFAQRSAKRDMLLYDDGGTFDLTWTVLMKHERMRTAFRDFVWKHWTEKRRGVVNYHVYTIEGDPTYYRIFIEPGPKGKWQVVSEWERWCCWFYRMEDSPKKMKRTTGVNVYTAVKRSDPTAVLVLKKRPTDKKGDIF